MASSGFGEKAREVQDYIKSYMFGAPESDDAAYNVEEPIFEYSDLSGEYKYVDPLPRTPDSSFHPVPLSDNPQEEPGPEVKALRGPPKPFRSAEIFKHVDKHAIEVANMYQDSFRKLIYQLIYAREIEDELEKARCIFVYCCSKNILGFDFDDVEPGSPERLLEELRTGKTTVALMFRLLCRYAGLHAKVIRGVAKGSDYTPGQKFKDNEMRHSWNVIFVCGKWRLVDCHWAARRLHGKKVTMESLKEEMDEYYFMPSPHQLIFTHLPDDPTLQLLPKPHNLDDFENAVALKASFFKHGLQILTHREAVIKVQREISIRVGCSQEKASSVEFTYAFTTDKGKDFFQERKLSHFGMHEMIGNVGFFTLRPPKKGMYHMVIYVKEGDEKMFGGVCEYQLECTETYREPKPFPQCTHTTWGEGDSFHRYDIMPYKVGAINKAPDGKIDLKFKIPKEMRFTAKMKTADKDEKELQYYVMTRVVGGQAIFTINAPESGDYGLEIFANDPEIDENALNHVYQYLIIAEHVVSSKDPFPMLPPTYLGPQPTFKKIGLQTVSHEDPYIVTDEGELEITFKFDLDNPVCMSAQLLYASHGRNDDRSDFVMQQAHDNYNIFQVRMGRAGFYRLQIFGMPRNEQRESIPGVFNYLINCTKAAKECKAYPVQYGVWKQGCYLLKPQQRDFERYIDKEVSFRMKVPGAEKVAVVVGEKWYHLTPMASGAWDGSVKLQDHFSKPGDVTVCANFNSKKGSFSTLLVYKLVQ